MYSQLKEVRNSLNYSCCTFIFDYLLVPDMVNGVMAQRPSHTGMVVSWSEPSQPMSQTLGYEVTYSPLGSLGSEVSVSVSGDITTTHVGGIEPNLAYNVRVRALSVMGYGPYSTTASVPGMLELVYQVC